MSPDVPLFMQVLCACLRFITGGAAESFQTGCDELRYDAGLPPSFRVGGDPFRLHEGVCNQQLRHIDDHFGQPPGSTMTSTRMPTRVRLYALNLGPSPTCFSGHGGIAVTMSPDVPLFMQVLCACLRFITGGAAESFQTGCDELRYDAGLPPSFRVGGDPFRLHEGVCNQQLRHIDDHFGQPPGSTMTSTRMPTRVRLYALNLGPSPTCFSGHGGIAVTMSPDVPLFMQVLCACLRFITGGAAESFQTGCDELRYDAGLPPSFRVGGDPFRLHEGVCNQQLRHIDDHFGQPPGSTMTSTRMPTRVRLYALNLGPSPTCFSGHGGIAVTMSPDVPLFMQVGDRKDSFRSDFIALIVLPCPQVLADCVCDCFSIVGLLLSLSGDVELNPGPITDAVCKEMLQNQKEILSKLTAVQEKQNSFETKILDMQNRLLVIETKVQSLDETRNRLATLETIVAECRDKSSSLLDQVDDLENRSRRNNLIIRGVAEDENEKEETLLKKVNDEIFSSTLKVNITSIERIHRIGKKNSGKTRPVILRLADYRDKMKVLQRCSRLKDTDYSISEDFSKRVQGIRKKLWDSAIEERKAGKKVKLVFDKLRVNNTLYCWNEARAERCKLGNDDATRDK
ncbi:uncharacterized protein LOC119406243 [Rhipicephalus sanguineus]|uniref:uncharacterized protein LOC119406243 n=1 Tax=Rhipicephalus sanguineus TaxID=34632 RepID=UPI0020C3B07C|nr:uncharacterized protein LOC119406243 [Rhipicephalus sanguineus]